MPATHETVLGLREMSCDHCVAHVTRTLSALPGVHNVEVSREAGTARVTHDEGTVTPETLAAASTRAGCPATPAA